MLHVVDSKPSIPLYYAQLIYEEGANSHSYARLTIDPPTTELLEEGTVVQGSALDGTPTQGSLAVEAPLNSTELLVRYEVIDSRENPSGCRMVSSISPVVTKCFVEGGSVTIGDSSYDYTYSMLHDNANAVSIQGFSLESTHHRQGNGNIELPLYDSIALHADYYSTEKYADRLVSAAFGRTDAELDRGNMDFSAFDPWTGAGTMELVMDSAGVLLLSSQTHPLNCIIGPFLSFIFYLALLSPPKTRP